jgi:hypothetical protein
MAKLAGIEYSHKPSPRFGRGLTKLPEGNRLPRVSLSLLFWYFGFWQKYQLSELQLFQRRAHASQNFKQKTYFFIFFS